MTDAESVQIVADDGVALSTRWFRPVGEPRGTVLIVPAMATKSRFYHPLAQWLSEQGLTAVTFDYRGYGESGDGNLREVRNDLLRWAQDAANVLDWVVKKADGVPVTWLGHSLGGQVLPLSDTSALRAAITVASGNGYWRTNSGALKYFAPLLWRAVMPISLRITGYFPGAKLRILGDLPPNVMRQWGRWCMNPDYLLGVHPELRARFAAMATPLTSISFTDDELMSGQSISDLHNFYPPVGRRMLRYSPMDLGRSRIGHFGFFRADSRPLWAEVLTPILR